MTKRNSTKDRRECFDTNKLVSDGGAIYLLCHVCKHNIPAAKETWEADHVTPHELGGTFVLPICIPCHEAKTKKDVTAIAKAKRVHDRHFGIKRSSRPMPGGKHSRLKKKFNGQVVERDIK